MKEFISQHESPSKFSFQPEQNSPLSKNIETEDAIKQVFEMYFNQEIPQSPKFNTPKEQYQQKFIDDIQNEQENQVNFESYLNIQDSKGQQIDINKNSERNAFSDITNQNIIKNINIQAFGKMQELGETIKNSLSSIHQKYSETKCTLNDLSKVQDFQDNLNIEKQQLNDIWDSQLNQYYQDFLNNAQDALLKATGTPGKFPKNKVISKNSAQKFPIQKPSAQKFSTSKVQHPPWNSQKLNQSQLQQTNLTRRLTGSAQKFSTVSKTSSLINNNKPMSVQKFPTLSSSGISLRTSNISSQPNKNALSQSKHIQSGKLSAQKNSLIKQNQTNNISMSNSKIATAGKLSTGKTGIISKSKDIKKITVPSRFNSYLKK